MRNVLTTLDRRHSPLHTRGAPPPPSTRPTTGTTASDFNFAGCAGGMIEGACAPSTPTGACSNVG